MKEFGQAYAYGYTETYNAYRDERNEQVLSAAAARLREYKAEEPVGTPVWHQLVGSLTALQVLGGEDI